MARRKKALKHGTGPTKAGKRHAYKAGPRTPIQHVVHSFVWFRKNGTEPDVWPLCPCGGVHLSWAWTGETD